MALQELDLKREYCPGKKANSRADALSRYPSLLATDCVDTEAETLVANIKSSTPDTENEKETLSECQHSNNQLAPTLRYLEQELMEFKVHNQYISPLLSSAHP